jgi:hypothetical protein
MPLSRPNKASIGQHDAEGPDASRNKLKASKIAPDLEGCGPSQPSNPNKDPTIDRCLYPGQTKLPPASTAPRDRTPSRNKLKASIVVPDLEGCGSSQPRNPIKPRQSTHALPRVNKASIGQDGGEGPDALQKQAKASIVVHDLEGCGPSQP